jgi:gliding motility-associated lipoprotein GldH
MKNIIISCCIFILALTSCSRGKIFEQYADIKGNIWNRFKIIEFEVNVTDTSPAYDFYVIIRHMEQIPLKYIDIDFTFYTPSGETRSSDQRIDFQDANGKPLGDGMGDLWDVRKLVRSGYKFTEPGTCKVEISSTMQYADLPGIMQVGLLVRKASP